MATFYEQYEGIAQLREIIEQQQEIIDRQRNALQLLLNEIWIHINSGGSDEQLQDAYRVVTSGNDEGILSIVAGTKKELDAIIERQRAIIERYNSVVEYCFLVNGKWDKADSFPSELSLMSAYEMAQNTSTMTGTTEE